MSRLNLYSLHNGLQKLPRTHQSDVRRPNLADTCLTFLLLSRSAELIFLTPSSELSNESNETTWRLCELLSNAIFNDKCSLCEGTTESPAHQRACIG